MTESGSGMSCEDCMCVDDIIVILLVVVAGLFALSTFILLISLICLLCRNCRKERNREKGETGKVNPSYWIGDSTLDQGPISASTPNLSDWSTPPATKIPKTFFPTRMDILTEENVDAMLTGRGLLTSISMANIAAGDDAMPKVRKSMSYGDLKVSTPDTLRRPPPPPPVRSPSEDKPKPRPRRLEKRNVSVLLEDGHKGKDNEYNSLKFDDSDDYINVKKLPDTQESKPSMNSPVYQELNVRQRDKPAQYAALKTL